MKDFLSYTLCTFLIFLPAVISGQEDRKVTARIEYTATEGMILLKATAVNNTPVYRELNYLLISIRKGDQGNLSSNRQSGKFSVNPGEVKILSEVNINLYKQGALKAFLYLKDEETQKLIAKDSLEFNGESFRSKTAKTEERVFSELGGLTIDETKSKTGKDFYDLFYMTYSLIPDKLDAAVKVSELPARGNSGQINIEVEDKVVYSFITNPGEDYLKEQLAAALKSIREFNAKKSLIRNEFTY